MLPRALRRLAVLGLALGTAFFVLAPAFAQAPPAVPALPDTERRTSYSLVASTCTACSVGFALYGDSTDYGAWIEVWLVTGSGTTTTSTLLTAVTDYTLASATGPIATIPRPITDATITLAAAKTGTLQIVGARRPRRTSQFAENRGVAARDLNQALTDIIASNRETWDRTKDVSARALLTMPGDTVGQLPATAVRAGGVLGFDISGNPIALAAGSSGTANVVGPNVSVVGHIATFGNTLGTILLDGGLVGAGDFVGPAGAVVNHVLTFASVTGKVGKDSGLTLTPSTGTITLTNAKTLTVDNSLEFAGTDSTVMTFPTTSATLARTDAANTFTGQQTIEGVTTTGATGTGNLVFSIAPTLGAITVTSVDKVAITAPATSATLTIADGKTLTDTSGVGASVLLGATGGGFTAYAGGSCTNQFIRSLSAAAAPTCASVANTDLTNSSLTIGSTSVSLGGTASTVAGLTLTAPTINGGTHQAITNLGIRSTGSGAFDLVLANTENLTAQRALTLTLNNAPRTLSLSGNITTAADFITAGGNAITLTTTGSTGVTLPTSGTLATRDTVNTFSATNTFSALQQFTDAKFSSGKIFPTADSTTALQVTKADGTTRILDFDTSNARLGINKTPGAFDLDVLGATNVGGRLTFSILDGASLAASPSTITDMTINNSPSSSNDYIGYYNAASSAWRRATIGSIAAAATGGVQNINGLCSGVGCTIAQGTGITVSSVGSTITIANAGVLAGGGGIVPTSGGPGTLFAEQMPVGGRVTLINGTCVATTDQAAATVVYYAPCGGGKYVPIYDGTNMELRQFTASDADTTGLTLTLGSNWAATTNYDVYIGLKSSVVTACTVAWTNSTTRATAVAQFKGVWTNGAVATCRDTNASTFSCAQNQCTLVGSFRTNGSTGQVDLKFGTNAANGGVSCICIWNVYNQVQASASVGDTTTTWAYTTAAFRVANGQTTNRIDYLQGLPGPPIDVTVLGYSSNSSVSVPQAVGIGIDSAVTNVATLNVGNVGAASTSLPSIAYLNGPSAYLSVGLHSINRLEFSGATGTTTWIGAIAANQIQTGIRGTFWY